MRNITKEKEENETVNRKENETVNKSTDRETIRHQLAAKSANPPICSPFC